MQGRTNLTQNEFSKIEFMPSLLVFLKKIGAYKFSPTTHLCEKRMSHLFTSEKSVPKIINGWVEGTTKNSMVVENLQWGNFIFNLMTPLF